MPHHEGSCASFLFRDVPQAPRVVLTSRCSVRICWCWMNWAWTLRGSQSGYYHHKKHHQSFWRNTFEKYQGGSTTTKWMQYTNNWVDNIHHNGIKSLISRGVHSNFNFASCLVCSVFSCQCQHEVRPQRLRNLTSVSQGIFIS